jgi:hypothetical protein
MKRAILIAIAAVAIAGSAAAQVTIELGFGAPPRQGDFWYGAPPSLAQRIQFLGSRMQRMHVEGRISPQEWDQDWSELQKIDYLRQALFDRDGGQWNPADHQLVWNHLDRFAHRLNWQSNLGY